MTDAAPAAGADEEAKTQAEAEKKKPLLRRLRRPPTALLVTLLGIALTAWLLPAITRQWNDRQSAHTVKAGIVSDMTAATEPVLLSGEDLWQSLPECTARNNVDITNYEEAFSLPPREVKCFERAKRKLVKLSRRIDRPWSLASAEIEARMRAYLDPQVVTGWEVFSWLIAHYDGSAAIGTFASTAFGNQEFLAAEKTGFDFQADAAHDLAAVLRNAHGLSAEHLFISPGWGLDHLRPALKRYDAYREIAGPRAPGGSAPPNEVYPLSEIPLSNYEQEIAREVLNSHVTGYSTTTNDLIHDLIP